MQKPLTKLNYSNSIHSITKSTLFHIRRDGRCCTKLMREHSINSDPDDKLFHWGCLLIPTNLADDRKASRLFSSHVKSKMPVNCCICRRKLADYDSLRRSSSGESVLFLAWKTSNSKYSLGIPRRSH